VEITPRIETQEPIVVDPDRLSRALRNLIENAVQFSPPGKSVTAEAREQRDGGGCRVVYAVTDHGPGFSDEVLAQAFEPFFSRRRGGTGLGLSIARRIAEEHGGRLRLANHGSGGGVATLELPMSLTPQEVTT
jgi:signal transduction histidine kinase